MGYETYQKVLAEAMEELGMETGINISNKEESSYIDDCTIETDQPALIPDSYIDITAEKIRIYKQLDSMEKDAEIDALKAQVSDRFGAFPEEVENLFNVVRVRNLGKTLGFEKIIIKNGIMILNFISNPLSPYYKSNTFESVLLKAGNNDALFKLKQTDTKLKIVAYNIDSISKAYTVLKKLG